GSFDDSAWKSGPAPLGYNEPDLGTEVGFGGNPSSRAITTYFRHSFQVENPEGIRELVLLLRVDDGAIIYLNGQEALRFNLRRGETASPTTPNKNSGGRKKSVYHRHKLRASLLLPGQNMLAAEVHQSSPQSDDLFLDLVLKSYRDGEEPGTA